MPHISRTSRLGALVAAGAVATALVSTPLASAATGGAGQGHQSDHARALTKGQLDRRGEKFTPRSDGTPGLVADASGESAAATQSGSASPQASKASGQTDATGGGLVQTGGWETPIGVVSTLVLGGSHDWVGIFSGGTVARYNANGNPVWQRTSHSLYRDWQVTPKLSFQDEPYTPVLYQGHCKVSTVCVQSTGDAGYPAGYSATDPWVLAIGGTHLELDDQGNTLAESAWAGGGGGQSFFEPRPAYQDGVQSSAHRTTPDVSMVADPRTGAAVYVTLDGQSLWLEVGGTSLSAPIWSGIMAATDQLRTDDGKSPLAVSGAHGDTAHQHIYALGSDVLFDVTQGANGLCGTECTAGPGYDTVTGLGSPTAGVDRALADMD